MSCIQLARTLGLCVILVCSLGCATVQQPTSIDVRRWVAERYVEPFQNGDVDTWLQVFADDALAMHNTLPPLRGRQAIRGFGEMVRDNLDIQRFDVEVLEIKQKGDFIMSDGAFVSRMVPRGTVHEGPDSAGKFVLVWQRQPDGEWRVILDMGNQSTRCGFEQCD